MSQLESALGTRLFERHSRGIHLTVRGQALLAHAERMLQLRRDMVAIAREPDAIGGRLVIGVAETIVQTWLPTLLARVHDLFPALTLEIQIDTTSLMRTHLLGHQIDLAFLMGPLQEPRVENLDLCCYRLAWLASPALKLGAEPLTLAEIGAWPLLTYPADSRPHQVLRQILSRAGVHDARLYGSASISTAARMVRDGIGVGVLAPAALRHELSAGQLRPIEVASEPLPDLAFTASWLRGSDSHVPAAVARLAVQVARDEGADSKS